MGGVDHVLFEIAGPLLIQTALSRMADMADEGGAASEGET